MTDPPLPSSLIPAAPLTLPEILEALGDDVRRARLARMACWNFTADGTNPDACALWRALLTHEDELEARWCQLKGVVDRR